MAKKIGQKLLSNAQDLEIYLSVEGLLGREKATRAAMARKYNVKPGVAESGYKRGKKLYEQGERPDAKEVEHENEVTAIQGDDLVGIKQLLIGTTFVFPDDPDTIHKVYGLDVDGGVVMVNDVKETCVEVDDGPCIKLIGEDNTLSGIAAAVEQMCTKYPNKTFEIGGKKYTFDEDTLQTFTLMGLLETTDGKDSTYAQLIEDGFANKVRELMAELANASNEDKPVERELEERKASKAQVVKDTNLGEVTDLPTIVNSTMALIVKDGKNHQIPATHPNFEKTCLAIKERRWDDAIKMMSLPEEISELTLGRVTIVRGRIEFDGEPIEHQGFTKRIVSMMKNGETESLHRLVKFLDKTMDNPSNSIVKRIYDFMKFNDIEIAEDGDIFVFKAVRSNYKDCHSGNIDNSVGAVVKMRRNRVNENQNDTCSYGLHVCALSYLPSYAGTNGAGNRIMKCKLNPRDIVSVPTDYKDAKIRCCKYVVVEDVTKDYRAGRINVDMEGIFSEPA